MIWLPSKKIFKNNITKRFILYVYSCSAWTPVTCRLELVFNQNGILLTAKMRKKYLMHFFRSYSSLHHHSPFVVHHTYIYLYYYSSILIIF